MKNSISRRGFVKTAATGFAGLVVVPSLGFPSSTIGAEDSPSMLETGDLFTSKFTSIVDIDGVIGSRLRANLENWELTAYRANPGMVEMFYDRDRTTPSDSISQESKLNPWSGEFVGKYLCASIRSYQ